MNQLPPGAGIATAVGWSVLAWEIVIRGGMFLWHIL